MKTLSEIFRESYTLINKTFPKNIVFDAKIHKVDDYNKRIFTIKLPNESVYLKCVSLMSITDIQENNLVRLNGKPRFNKNGTLCIQIDELYVIDIEQKTTTSLNRLTSLISKLNTKNSLVTLNKIKNKKIPLKVENIGVIYVNRSNQNKCLKKTIIEQLTHFKGGIYFLNIDLENVENCLHDGLELFRKYYNINVVSIVSNGLTIDEIVELNSTNIVKYLLLNKNSYPYLTFFSTQLNDTQPISKLVNRCFNTIEENTNFINECNKMYTEDVHNTCTKTKLRISNMLLLLENYIMKTEIFIIDTFEQFINTNPVNDAKKLIMNDLNNIEQQLGFCLLNLLTNIVSNINFDEISNITNIKTNSTITGSDENYVNKTVQSPIETQLQIPIDNIINTVNDSNTTIIVTDDAKTLPILEIIQS